MRKLFLALLAVCLVAGGSYASQVTTEIIDETLSTTNTVGEADLNIESAKRVTFFATIDNNRTTASVTATVTVAYSLDGTNWQDISWMDVAGGVTPQTTESTTDKKQTYIGWVDNRLIGKYIRIRVNATELAHNWNSMYMPADNATISVTIVEDK